MKNFVVIGLGNFGYNLAIALSQRKNYVLVIDEDEKKIENIKDMVSQAIVADVKNKKVLSEFVPENADAVIVGLGDDIASSVLTVLHLKSLGIKRIIAKAVSYSHAKILGAVGAADVVFPEKDTASRLAATLTTKNLIENIPMTEEYSIVEIAVPDSMVGKTLAQLNLRKRYDIYVIAVKDVLLDKFYLIPKADFILRPDSTLIIIGKSSDIEKLQM